MSYEFNNDKQEHLQEATQEDEADDSTGMSKIKQRLITKSNYRRRRNDLERDTCRTCLADRLQLIK